MHGRDSSTPPLLPLTLNVVKGQGQDSGYGTRALQCMCSVVAFGVHRIASLMLCELRDRRLVSTPALPGTCIRGMCAPGKCTAEDAMSPWCLKRRSAQRDTTYLTTPSARG